MAQDKFNIEKLQSNFQASLKDQTDVSLEYYLAGFKELYKFFQLMGTVFGFVSSDVKAKIDILEMLRQKHDDGTNFESFSSMLEFEKSSGLLSKSDYVSGSRTLLRLHRGLAFIYEFLNKLHQIEPHEKTNGVCKAAYNDTLAQYHPWIVRQGAMVAMYAMPTREQLLNRVCLDVDRAINILPEVLEISKVVYDRTDKLYTDYDLHALP